MADGLPQPGLAHEHPAAASGRVTALFKRLRWVSVGMVIGCSGTLWVQRKARALIEQVLPRRLADRAALRARSVGADLRHTLTERHHAMRGGKPGTRWQGDRGASTLRHPRRQHPSVANDHPSLSAPHLHVVDEGRLAAEDPSRRR